MNKHLLKLLEDYTAPDGTKHLKGSTISIEDDDALAHSLVFEGKAEKANPAKDQDDLTKTINKAIEVAVEKHVKPIHDKIHDITTHDKEDDDPLDGYIPQRIRKDDYTKEEKQYAFGQYLIDIYKASAPGAQLPPRMKRAQERSTKMHEDAIDKGFITKAAGSPSQTIGADAEGGFLLQDQFSMMLMDQALETAQIRPRSTIIQIEGGGNTIRLPQGKNYDHSSNLIHGGMQALFKGEESELTSKQVLLEEVKLELNKLTVLAFASGEMIRFSPISVSSWLLPKMGEAITFKEEDVFINGSGAGQPLGLKLAPSLITIAIETGQDLATTAIVTNNVLKMFQQVRIEKMASTVFLYNRVDAFLLLATLKIEVGTGGSHVGLITRVPGTPNMDLLGIPLVDTEHMQALGTVNDFAITDLSQYIIADDRVGPSIATSIHLKFDFDQEAFRIIKYVDGQPRYSQVFKRQNATNTSASVVNLAART